MSNFTNNIRIICCVLFATVVLSSSFAKEKNNYLAYHENMLKAELLASDNQFKKALNIYSETFSEYDFVFLRDYKIATQLAFFTGDKNKGISYLKAGIKQGWSLKQLKKNRFIKTHLSKKEWNVIEKEYPKLRENYHKNINQELKNEIHGMFKKDQKLALGALFRIGDKAQIRYAEKKFAPNNTAQVYRLLEVLKQYGFPEEKVIGTRQSCYWMQTILVHRNSISREFNEKDQLYTQIRPMLMAALEKGEITPYSIAIIDNWRISVNTGWGMKSYGYLSEKMTKDELKNANKLRKKLGLRSIETRNKLIETQKKTGMKFYLPQWPKPNKKIEIIESKKIS